jgi:hypothetical protein
MTPLSAVTESVTSDVDHDLPDVLLARQVVVCLLEVLKLEHAVDNRADLVGGDHPVHVFELRDAADGDAAEDGGGGDDHGGDLARIASLGEEADEMDVARHAQGREGFGQGSGPANLDDVVYASPARLPRGQYDVRRG